MARVAVARRSWACHMAPLVVLVALLAVAVGPGRAQQPASFTETLFFGSATCSGVPAGTRAVVFNRCLASLAGGNPSFFAVYGFETGAVCTPTAMVRYQQFSPVDATCQGVAPPVTAVVGVGVCRNVTLPGVTGPASVLVTCEDNRGQSIPAPTGVTVTAAGPTRVSVSWQAPPPGPSGEAVVGYKVGYVKTLDVTPRPLVAATPGRCLSVPGKDRFIFGRTTAVECAESLGYGGCAGDVARLGSTGFVCNAWSAGLWPQTHTGFSQLFFDNDVARFRIDYRFASAQTLAQRFNGASSRGEAAEWRVTTAAGTVNRTGTWFFSSSMAGFKTGLADQGFSSASGLWAAADGKVDGTLGVLAGSYGHGSISGEQTCSTLYEDGGKQVSANVRSTLFFDGTCGGEDCGQPNVCRQSGVCCDGQCFAAANPDGILCGTTGRCVAGRCVEVGTLESLGNQTSVTLEGLAPFENYQIAVLAFGAFSDGAFATAGATTPEGKPTGAPLGLAVSSLASLGLTASWSAPVLRERRGAILGYKVEVRRSNATDVLFGGVADGGVVTDVGNVTNITLAQAFGALSYDVRVLAYTAVGDGPWSGAQSQVTQDGIPIVAPANVTVLVNGPKELVVSWVTPSDQPINGVIVGTEASITSNLGESSPGSFLRSPSNVTAAGGRAYDVTLRFRSAAGVGPASTVVRVQTPDDNPSAAPRNVSGIALNATALQVSYRAPAQADLNGALQGYKVAVLPTFGLSRVQGFPVAAPTCTGSSGGGGSSGKRLPSKYFAFARTTASRCSESMGYGPCGSGGASFGTVCNSWPASVWAQTHDSWTQLIFTSTAGTGGTAWMRIDWQFRTTRTLASRFNVAYRSGEPVTWKITRPSGAVVTVSGTWFFSDGLGGFKSGTSGSGFSADDGWWGGGAGTVNGNGVIPSTRYGQGNINGGDGSCTAFVDGTSSLSFSSGTSVMFFEEAATPRCLAVCGTATPCREAGTCCGDECQARSKPDGSLCGVVGQCQAGECIAGTGLTVTDVGNTTVGAVGGLEAFEPYQVSVLAYTSGGDGPLSASVDVSLGEDKPTGPPVAVSVSSLASLGLTVSWSAPVLRERRGAILGYKVEVRRSNATDVLFGGVADGGVVTDVGNVTNITLAQAFGALSYDVRVLAYTAVGDGPWSGAQSQVTQDGIPIVAPANVTVLVNGPKELVVSWVTPSDQPINGTVLSVEASADSDLFERATFGAAAPGLLPVRGGRGHNVTLRFRSAAGVGPASTVVRVQTPDDNPSAAPRNVSGIALNATALQVSYRAPAQADLNGALQGYKVAVLPTFGLSRVQGFPVAAPTCTGSSGGGGSSGKRLPSKYFAFARTTASRCSESMGYGPCGSGGASFGTVCNSWPASVWAQTHDSWTQLIFTSTAGTGGTAWMRIDWQFRTTRTLASRFNVAYRSGEPVTWKITRPSGAVVTVSGTWFFSDGLGGFKSGTSGSGFSADDGWWGGGAGTVNGNGVIPSTRYGQGNINGGDGSCTTFVDGTSSLSFSSGTSVMFFEEAATPRCLAVCGTATPCREAGTCCGDECQARSKPDGSLCGVVGQCKAGECIAGTGLTVTDVGNTTVGAVGGLEAFEPYQVSVLAYTSGGDGPLSASVDVSLGEDKPTGPPVAVSVSSLASLGLTVSWSAPVLRERRGAILGYKVEVRRSNATDVLFGGVADGGVVTDVGNVTNITLAQAFGALSYDVRVLAYTAVGDGPWSGAQSQVTQDGIPIVAPANVTVLVNGPKELVVSWVTPSDQPINGTVLSVEASADSDLFERATFGAAAPGLLPVRGGRGHNVTLRFRSAAGVGPASTVVRVQTPDDNPSAAPRNVSGIALNATALQVSYRAPAQADLNGALQGYKVAVLPTFGLSRVQGFPVAAPTCTGSSGGGGSSGKRLPSKYFAFARTTASRCSESMGYGPCGSGGASFGTVCNSWPASVWAQTHDSWTQLIFTSTAGTGGTAWMRIDWQFRTTRTLASRFNVAYRSGEPVTWKITRPSGAVVTVSGTWFFSDGLGGFKSGTSGSGFSADDGWWGGGAGTVNGNGVIPSTRYGQGNINGGDGSCTTFVDGTSSLSFSSGTSVMFFEEAATPRCLAVCGTATPCREAGTCCGDECQARSKPDGSLCGVVGQCQAGECIAGTGLTVTDVGNTTVGAVGGLEAFEPYQVSVLAYTSGGDGPLSASVDVSLGEDKPTGPPVAVSVSSLASLGLTVSWSAPVLRERRGAILGYKVEVRRSNATDVLFGGVADGGVVTDVGNVTNITLAQAFGALSYDVRVLAYTAVGDGPWSGAQSQVTQDGIPIVAPANVTVLVNGPKELVVSWVTPSDQPINGTVLSVEASADSDLFERATFGAAAPGLLPVRGGRGHNVTLRFRSAAGVGPASTVVRVQTPEDAPSAPAQNVAVKTINATALQVSYRAPAQADLNGALQGYKVAVLPTFGLSRVQGFPVAAPTCTGSSGGGGSSGKRLPSKYFAFARTTASRCSESMGYGPCGSGGASFGTVCNSWPASVWAQTHDSWTQLIFTSTAGTGGTAWMRIDWQFRTTRTLASRFNVAYRSGEPVTWKITRPSGAVVTVSGTWFFSDGLGGFKSGTSGSGFSADDGWWGGGAGTVNGNGVIPSTRYGQGNINGGDGSCTTFVDGTSSLSFSSGTSVMFFEEAATPRCLAVCGTATPCREAGTCCGDECQARSKPDGSLCGTFGQCQAGECVATPGLTVTDVGLLDNVTVNDLLPFRPYQVSVLAYTSGGDGPFSAPLSVLSGEASPRGPPLAVMATGPATPQAGSSVVLVSWAPPDPALQGGVIAGYKVLLERSAVSNGDFGNVTTPLSVNVGNITQASINVPFGGVLYSIRVVAYTSGGDGVVSAPVLGRSSETTPSGPPHTLAVRAISPVEVLLTWEPVPREFRNSEVASYIVSFTVDGGARQTMATAPGAKSAALRSTLAYSLFNVTVRASNAAGVGPAAVGVEARGQEGTPLDAPSGLVAAAVSPVVQELRFVSPTANRVRGVLVGYRVTTIVEADSSGAPSSMQSTLVVNASQLGSARVEVPVLPYSLNTFRVSAGTGPGFGPAVTISGVRAAQGTPTRPLNPAGSAGSAQSATVLWDAPNPANGIISSYRVEYNGVLSPGNVSSVVVAGGTQTTVSGLVPFTTYLFRVFASTSAQGAGDATGEGPASEQISVSTLESTPEAPANLQGRAVTPTSLGMTWLPPPVANGVLDDYQLEYRVAGSAAQFERLFLSNTTLSATVAGLVVDTVYEVRLRAQTGAGLGAIATLEVRTGESIPVRGPNVATATATAPGTVSVSWDVLAPEFASGKVLGYLLVVNVSEAEAHLLGASQLRSTTLNVTSRMGEVTGLASFRSYDVQVAAYTKKGAGPVGPAVAVRTVATIVTGPPLGLEVNASSSRGLTARWGAPASDLQNGPISNYTVFHRRSAAADAFLGGARDVEVEAVVAQASSVVGSLLPGLEYEVAVAASNPVGRGPRSQAVLVTSLEEAPSGRVRGFVSTLSGQRSVEVAWTDVAPAGRNGVITGYLVAWTSVFGGSTMRVNASAGRATLPSLEEFTNYTVSVAAETAVGTGPSVSLVAATLAAAPSGAPQGVAVAQRTATSVVASWSQPAAIDANGRLVGYATSIRRVCDATTSNACGIDPACNTSATVRQGAGLSGSFVGLLPNTEYAVRVAAVGSEGRGPFSGEVMVRTLESRPTAGPRGLAANATERGAMLMWSCIDIGSRNAEVSGYRVQVERSNNASDLRLQMVAEQKARVSGLRPFTDYVARVEAVTAAGLSPHSSVVFQTQEDRPSAAPVGMTIRPTSYTSLRVSWGSPPQEAQNGRLLGYLLRYSPRNNPAEVTTIDVGLVTTEELVQLQRNVAYVVTVAAYTKAGAGPYSAADDRAAVGVPSAATCIEAEENDETTGACVAVRSDKSSLPIIPIAAGAGGLLLCILLILVLCLCRRKRRGDKVDSAALPDTYSLASVRSGSSTGDIPLATAGANTGVRNPLFNGEYAYESGHIEPVYADAGADSGYAVAPSQAVYDNAEQPGGEPLYANGIDVAGMEPAYMNGAQPPTPVHSAQHPYVNGGAGSQPVYEGQGADSEDLYQAVTFHPSSTAGGPQRRRQDSGYIDVLPENGESAL